MCGFDELPAGQPRGAKRAAAVGPVQDGQLACWRPPKRKKASAKPVGKNSAPLAQAIAGSSGDAPPIDNAGGGVIDPPAAQVEVSGVEAAVLGKRGKQLKRQFVCKLEGVDMFREVRDEPGQPKHTYNRFIARCALADCAHWKECERKRSLSTKLAGDIPAHEAALALLGCWLQAADLFEDRAGHMEWNPSKQDIRAYAVRELGWVAPL